MTDLRIHAAHGWRHDSRRGVAFRVDYYAIGNPDLFGLFAAIVATKGRLPNIGIETAPHLAPTQNLVTVSDYAAFWAEQFGNPHPGKGGGELLNEDSVLITAACHPNWFSIADLRHLRAVAEERCAQLDEGENSDIVVARDELRSFLDALSCLDDQGGAYDG